VTDAALRNLIRQRAGNRCEYCGIWQEHIPFALFHIDHIMPKKHGGDDDPSNLALACHHCNFHKGPNLTGIDPESGNITPLFHPRNERWEAHFELRDVTIVGLTPVGRATVQVLNMNAAERVQLRAELKARG
jgi:hypothetical protein